MTAEQIYQKFNNEFYLEGNNGGIQKHKRYILKMMNEYARLMCDKQKEICAHEVDFNSDYYDMPYGASCTIDKDSILNASYPDELQSNN